MLNGFEKETAPLTDYERDVLLPVLVRGLSAKYGPGAAVKNATICEKLRAKGYEISEARVRKIVNHIRVTSAVPCLMATSRGYYISLDPEELQGYISSLFGREQAIRQVREALEEQLQQLKAR